MSEDSYLDFDADRRGGGQPYRDPFAGLRGEAAGAVAPPKAPPRRGGVAREVRPYGAGDPRAVAQPVAAAGASALDLKPAEVTPAWQAGVRAANAEWDSVSPRRQAEILLQRQREAQAQEVSARPSRGPSESDEMAAWVRNNLAKAGVSARGSLVNDLAGYVTERGNDLKLSAVKGMYAGAGLGLKILDLATLGQFDPAVLSDGSGDSVFARGVRMADRAQEIAESMQSSRLQREMAALRSAEGFVPSVGAVLANPLAVLDTAVSSVVGSGGLGGLIARGGGRAAVMMASRRGITDAVTLGRVYRAGAETASAFGTMAMNAGDTFAETRGELGDKLHAAMVAAAGTHAAGRLLHGSGGKAGTRAGQLKATVKEPVGEVLESLSQSAGQAIGEGRALDLDQTAGKMVVEAAATAHSGVAAGWSARGTGARPAPGPLQGPRQGPMDRPADRPADGPAEPGSRDTRDPGTDQGDHRTGDAPPPAPAPRGLINGARARTAQAEAGATPLGDGVAADGPRASSPAPAPSAPAPATAETNTDAELATRAQPGTDTDPDAQTPAPPPQRQTPSQGQQQEQQAQDGEGAGPPRAAPSPAPSTALPTEPSAVPSPPPSQDVAPVPAQALPEVRAPDTHTDTRADADPTAPHADAGNQADNGTNGRPALRSDAAPAPDHSAARAAAQATHPARDEAPQVQGAAGLGPGGAPLARGGPAPAQGPVDEAPHQPPGGPRLAASGEPAGGSASSPTHSPTHGRTHGPTEGSSHPPDRAEAAEAVQAPVPPPAVQPATGGAESVAGGPVMPSRAPPHAAQGMPPGQAPGRGPVTEGGARGERGALNSLGESLQGGQDTPQQTGQVRGERSQDIEAVERLEGTQGGRSAGTDADAHTGAAAGGQAPGLPAARVDALARQAMGAWANKPDVVVLPSMDDARTPQALRSHDARQRAAGAKGSVRAAYWQGTVYLFADQLHHPAQVREALVHEALGHFGLRGFYRAQGVDLAPELRRVAVYAPRRVAERLVTYGLVTGFAAEGEEFVDQATGRPATARTVIAAATPAAVLEAAEEVLARLAETRPGTGLVQTVLAKIRAWARVHVPGFAALRMSDAELIQRYVLPARRWVEQGHGHATAGAAAVNVRATLDALQSGALSREAAERQLMGWHTAWQTNPQTGQAPVFSRSGEGGGVGLSDAGRHDNQDGGPADPVVVRRPARNFDEAEAAAAAFTGRLLTNAGTGMAVEMPHGQLRTMLSGGGWRDPSLVAHKSLAVANLDQLFARAVHGWSTPRRDGAIHRFFAPISIDGRVQVVQITVRETEPAKQSGARYVVQAVDMDTRDTPMQSLRWVGDTLQADGVAADKDAGARAALDMAAAADAHNAEQEGLGATWFGGIVRLLQDGQADLNAVSQAIRTQGKKEKAKGDGKAAGNGAGQEKAAAPDTPSPGTGPEGPLPAGVARRTQDFATRELLPLLVTLRSAGISVAQLDDYLRTRAGAPGTPPATLTALKKLAQRVDGIVQGTAKLMAARAKPGAPVTLAAVLRAREVAIVRAERKTAAKAAQREKWRQLGKVYQQYSVLFEMQLDVADFGQNEKIHYKKANEKLAQAMRENPEFAAMMEEMIPGIKDSIENAGGRSPSKDWTWEHASSSTASEQLGVMRLVPREQHTAGSPQWRALHPDKGAGGGYTEWARQADAPQRRRGGKKKKNGPPDPTPAQGDPGPVA